MFKPLCTIAIVVAAVTMGDARGAERQPTRQFVIRIKVNESVTAPDQAPKTSCLAAPAITVAADREAHVRVGGEQAIGDQNVEFGTEARIRVRDNGREEVTLRGVLEVSEIMTLGDEFVGRRGLAAYFNKTVTLGKAVRIELPAAGSEQHWIEVIVDLAEPIADAAISRPTSAAEPISPIAPAASATGAS